MPWTLMHYPATEEWEKTFPTEQAAVTELRKHICEECMRGELSYVDSSEPTGVGVEKRDAPNPDDAGALLSTPCGLEYGLSENDGTDE